MQTEEKKTAVSQKKELARTLALVSLIVIGTVTLIYNIQYITGPSDKIDDTSGPQFRQRSVGSTEPPPPPTPENFKPFRAVEEMPSLTEFNIVPAEMVGEGVSDDDLVVGVVINGEARAYPLNMMTGPQREIFNDVLGGKEIAATW